MVFKRQSSTYVIKAYMNNKKTANFVLDTGSPLTIMSLKTLQSLIDVIPVDFIKRLETIELHGYGGSKVYMIPCYLRNVHLGKTLFEKFYFLLDISNLFLPDNVKSYTSNSLIGFDVIDNCTLKSNCHADFTATDFDKDNYVKYWNQIIPTAIEICNIT